VEIHEEPHYQPLYIASSLNSEKRGFNQAF